MDVYNERTELHQKISFQIICPRNSKHEVRAGNLPHVQFGRSTGQLWEQFELPRSDYGDLLVNLCNLSPLVTRNAVTMIMDAQVYLTPDSYSKAFETWYKFALPRIGRRARKILTISQYSAEQLAAFNVAPLEKIEVVHCGVDHILERASDRSTIDALNLSDGSFFLALANTQAHKNIGVLFAAFQDPRLSEQTLLLFGGATKEDFEASGIQVPNNVIFAGRVSDEQLRSLMEASRALLFPSKTEGFGLPPLEAMMLGTPAVCAVAGALPEVCGEPSFYADANAPAEWADAIHKIASSSESDYAEIAKASVEQASKFTWRAGGEILLNEIMKTLNII